MSWYHSIKIAASPKNIINNWKVDDPFLKFFIYTYEPLIDLSKIKSQDDLKTFIKGELLPSLKEKITRNKPTSYYKKTMTDEEAIGEIEAHGDDPRLGSAVQTFKRDPAAAKKILIKAINDDKQLMFDRWWGYMEKDYADNPAFSYSMLNPMFESSPATQKAGPPPAHREAVAEIHDEIGTKGVSQMNVFKKFNKISFDLDKTSSKAIDLDEKGNKCWVRVDSRKTDPEKYNSNLEKLMRFSTGSGWCIAQNSMAESYLPKGNFWLYFENKRPKAAIRLVDNDVAEMRGCFNKDKNLDPYWEQVTSFLHSTDINYKSNYSYKRLIDIRNKNVNLKDMEETDPEKFRQMHDNFMLSIKKDPKQLGQISEQNKLNYPEFIDAAAEGYDIQMNKLLTAIEEIPVDSQTSQSRSEYHKRFSNFQDEFNDIPPEVKPRMSQDIQGRLVTVHKNVFMKNPLEYEFFPEDMKAIITKEDKIKSWGSYVGADPYRYNDLINRRGSSGGEEGGMDFAEIIKHVPVGPVLKGWANLVDMNIDHGDNIPKFLLNLKNSKGQTFFPPNYIENKIIADFKKYPCNRTSQGYDKLEKIKERKLLTEEQISQAYVDFVNRNANNKKMQDPTRYVPPQYRDAVKGGVENIYPIADRYYNQVVSNASYFGPIDNQRIRELLLTDQKYQNGIIGAFARLREEKYGENWAGFWKDIPDDAKRIMPGYITEAVANSWLPYIQGDPTLMDSLDFIIRPLVKVKLQQPPTTPTIEGHGNWYKKIKGQNYELV